MIKKICLSEYLELGGKPKEGDEFIALIPTIVGTKECSYHKAIFVKMENEQPKDKSKYWLPVATVKVERTFKDGRKKETLLTTSFLMKKANIQVIE